MREVGVKLVIVIVSILLLFGLARGCSEQSITKNFGGSMDIELEPNTKLVNVSWKDDSLWILTKDMSDTDVAEEYNFFEKDCIGMLEGNVKIHETKISEDEYKDYTEQKVLKTDFYKSGNYIGENYDESESEDSANYYKYIIYNQDTDTYTKIRDYDYNEYGELVDKK